MAYVPDEAIKNMDTIPGAAFKLYTYYCMRADDRGICYPSLKKTAEDTRLGYSYTSEMRTALLRANWIDFDENNRIQLRMGFISEKPKENELNNRKQTDGDSGNPKDEKIRKKRNSFGKSEIVSEYPNNYFGISEIPTCSEPAQLTIENADAFSSPHSELMDFLSTQCGKYPDGAAQGRAVKWLLKNGFTVEQCKACLVDLQTQDWRTNRISWITVQKEIADWLRRQNGNGNGHKENPEWRKRVEELRMNLGCSTCENVKGRSGFPFGKGYIAYPYGSGLSPPCPGCNPRHEGHPKHGEYLEIQALKDSNGKIR